ncbi:MAG: hypothetical protein ABIV13_05255 [Fimbriimonadales bacterium]
MRSIAVLVAIGAISVAPAITLGQIDTFEDGTIMDWNGDQGTPPANVVTGGPRGVDDNYIRVFSGIGGAMHNSMYNQFQWTGDWLAAGVNVVEVHVKNDGPDAVNLRAVWHGQLMARWTSTKAVAIPADGVWYKVAFPCRESDLTKVLVGQGGETYSQVMSDVERFMIRHDSGPPSSGGSPVEATVGYDNIEASNKADFQPYSLTPVRGLQTGTFFDILFSDDRRISWKPGITFTTAQAPVEFTVTSYAPTMTNVTSMTFNLEGHATAPLIRRQIEMRNYTTGLWTVVSPFANSATSDELITVPVAPANYINPSDGKMEARIGYKAFGPVFVYPWQARQDRIFFRLTP